MSNSSISTIDRTLSGSTIQSQSGPVSNGNEGVLHIPQSSSITGASLSDCLVSYLGQFSGESYPSAVPADLAGIGIRDLSSNPE